METRFFLSVSFYFFYSILNDDEKALISFCWDYGVGDGVALPACLLGWHVVDARFVSSIVIFLCVCVCECCAKQ